MPCPRVAYQSCTPRAARLAVVIPARNEAAHIADTLRSWAGQQRPDGSPVPASRYELVLVTNNCTDDTVAQACAFARTRPRLALTVLDVQLGAPQANVGSARALGGRYVLDRRPGDSAALFFSDADTLADPRLVYHLRRQFATPGVSAVGAYLATRSAVLGGYHQRFLQYEAQLNAYLAQLANRPVTHRYFSGAGMGVRINAYRAVGGIQPLAFNEDKQLRSALEARDFGIAYPTECVVHTSCRQVGRVSWGMSKQLAYWAARERQGLPLLVPHPGAAIARVDLRRAIVALRKDRPDAWHRLAARWWTPTVAHHYLRFVCNAAFVGEAVDRVWHCPNFVQQRRRAFPELPVAEALALLGKTTQAVA